MAQPGGRAVEKELNKDCNNTVVLQEKLMVAIGACIMLCLKHRHKVWHRNGAIGMIISLSSSIIRVKFDHLSEPFGVEMVKNRFMIMTYYYEYRKQLPII